MRYLNICTGKAKYLRLQNRISWISFNTISLRFDRCFNDTDEPVTWCFKNVLTPMKRRWAAAHRLRVIVFCTTTRPGSIKKSAFRVHHVEHVNPALELGAGHCRLQLKGVGRNFSLQPKFDTREVALSWYSLRHQPCMRKGGASLQSSWTKPARRGEAITGEA